MPDSKAAAKRVIKTTPIDSMSHGAYAIATDPENGKKIFVENACPGDLLDLEIYDDRKDFSFAHITETHTESELRRRSEL